MDAGLVVSAIAEILGVIENAEEPLQDALEQTLRERAILLVLDNFEQVIEAGVAVERLLRAAPRLKVLVTSRAVLHRYGEHEFPVPPLDLPDLRNLPDPASLTHYEAIGLFLERAVAVKPNFALTPDNAPSIAEIAVRLDGLPLAIELAASRVKVLSPQGIIDRMGKGAPTLTSRIAGAPERQRTLRGAIQWSYDLLHEDERLLFEQISVFQGGASLDAIESVCPPVSGADTLDELASLVDNSLLRQFETEDGEPRFGMLETIKEYARERLDHRPELLATTRRAHADFFADFAMRQSEQLTGYGREPAVAAMATDVENLRVAWRHWVNESDLDQLNKLVDGLGLLYDAKGWYHATIELTTDLLSVLASTPSTPERAMQEVMLRTSLARALMAVNGYTQEVEDAYAQALELFEGQRELPQLFPVLRGLASFYNYRAEFEKAAHVGEQILRLADAQDDPGMRVDGHLLLGASKAMRNDLQAGSDHLDSAIACFESQGYRSGRFRLGNNPVVACFTTSALVSWLLGYPDRALERARRAVGLANELGHPFTLAYGLFHTGFLHLWRREPDLVMERATGVLEVADRHDLPIWKALGTCLQGAADAASGRAEEGLALIHHGLDLYQGLKTPPVFWPLLLSVQAGAYARAGQAAEGLGLIQEAIEIIGSGAMVPEFHVLRGELLLLHPDNVTDAELAFEQAFDLARTLDAKMSQLRAAVRIARLRRAEGEMDSAERGLRRVYESFTEGFTTLDLLEARELVNGTS